MVMTSKTIRESLLRLRSCLPGGGLGRRYAVDEPPLRSELFSADQMEQHGKALAASHTLIEGRAPDQLLTRLAKNEVALIHPQTQIVEYRLI